MRPLLTSYLTLFSNSCRCAVFSYTPLNYTNPNNEYKIAQYDPIRAPVMYTVIPNGLVQYSTAGDFDGNFPRALNTTYICNASALTPFIVSYNSAQVPHPVGGLQRIYQLLIQTSVVCGAPYQPVTGCAFGPVNLNPLVGTTVVGSYNGATYQAAPCSAVHASQTSGCTGQVCQTGYPLSYYDPLNTQWTQSDTGLVQFNQDGVFCGTSFARATTIRYVCNAGATTPSMSYAVEDPVCEHSHHTSQRPLRQCSLFGIRPLTHRVTCAAHLFAGMSLHYRHPDVARLQPDIADPLPCESRCGLDLGVRPVRWRRLPAGCRGADR